MIYKSTTNSYSEVPDFDKYLENRENLNVILNVIYTYSSLPLENVSPEKTKKIQFWIKKKFQEYLYHNKVLELIYMKILGRKENFSFKGFDFIEKITKDWKSIKVKHIFFVNNFFIFRVQICL